MISATSARFALGEIVRHRDAAFRGVVIDVDPVFSGRVGQTGQTSPDQPFYQVLALGEDGGFMAYAAEDALERDPEFAALSITDKRRWFNVDRAGHHTPKAQALH
jgi:heat shock protein HspQ